MIPQPGEQYRHYKSTGGVDYTYEIIGVGIHTETGEVGVIYKALYGHSDSYWIRPLSMRDERVEYNGQQLQRFTRIS